MVRLHLQPDIQHLNGHCYLVYSTGLALPSGGAVAGREDGVGKLSHGRIGAFGVVGVALEGVEPALDDAPGVVALGDFAGGFRFAAEAAELAIHDVLALALVGFFGGDIGLVFEPAELVDGAESRLEPLDVGGEVAGDGFAVFFAVAVG
jgi:hypothetical protein